MSAPNLRELSRVSMRIGLLSFGGPAAQIALMHREFVDRRDWLSEQTFLRALSLCMLLPGPEAMQLATYAGWRLRGIAGGLVAGGLFVLPGAVIIAILAAGYLRFGDLPLVHAAFLGIKATVVVIVLQALGRLAGKTLSAPDAWCLAALSFIGIFALDLPFPLIVALAALWGFSTSPNTVTSPSEMPARSHAPLRTLALWGALWLLPLVLLGQSSLPVLPEIGWFFARLAVVTFGGAYAVLAYMTQTFAGDLGWISTAQMIDALGLAETTPGPLILVTQFVAMLAGHAQGGWPLAAAAAIVALWATFVPCFLWIFLTGPYLDRIAERPRLAAALRAITAAVVGVILNLTLWFAMHVLFAQIDTMRLGPASFAVPAIGTLDLTALALMLLAGTLIFARHLGLGAVLGLMALAGAATHLL